MWKLGHRRSGTWTASFSSWPPVPGDPHLRPTPWATVGRLSGPPVRTAAQKRRRWWFSVAGVVMAARVCSWGLPSSLVSPSVWESPKHLSSSRWLFPGQLSQQRMQVCSQRGRAPQPVRLQLPCPPGTIPEVSYIWRSTTLASQAPCCSLLGHCGGRVPSSSAFPHLRG